MTTADPFGTTATAPAGASGDPFGGPAPASKFPAVAGLKGRLLLVKPTKLETGITSRFKEADGSAKTQDRLTATIVVLDGPATFTWVDREGDQQTLTADADGAPFSIPVEFTDMYLSQAKLIGEVKKYLNARPGEASMALGRLIKLPPRDGQSGAWSLESPTSGDADLARKYIASRAQSVFG